MCWYLDVVEVGCDDVGLVECVMCIVMLVNDDVCVVWVLKLWEVCVLCLLVMCSSVVVLVMC